MSEPVDFVDVREALLGTCKADYEAAEELGISDMEVLDLAFHAEIERCTVCSWWCEDHEMKLVDGEHVCEECHEL